MTHAKTLRVIGQKIELARISLFQLEHDGQRLTVQSDLMSRTAEWMLRYVTSESEFSTNKRFRGGPKAPVESKPITFSDADLERLDRLETKRRRELFGPPTEREIKLSHLLRSLGEYLDANHVRTFSIYWTPSSVVVDYKKSGGFTDRLRFAPAKLAESVTAGFHRPALQK